MRKIGLLFLFAALLAVGTTACTGGDDDDDDDDDDGATGEVSGEIHIDGNGGGTPGAGLTVTEAGTSNSTTADGAGLYTITIPAGEEVFLRASGGAIFPSQRGIVVTTAGNPDFNLSGPDATLVAAVAAGLGVTFDTSKAIVSFNFGGAVVGSAGGIAATMSLGADGSFTFDSAGNPVMSTTTLPNGETNLIFYNVDPGTATFSIDLPGAGTCVEQGGVTSLRVDANVITEAGFNCN